MHWYHWGSMGCSWRLIGPGHPSSLALTTLNWLDIILSLKNPTGISVKIHRNYVKGKPGTSFSAYSRCEIVSEIFFEDLKTHLFTLMSFQTYMHFFLLLNTYGGILKNVSKQIPIDIYCIFCPW